MATRSCTAGTKPPVYTIPPHCGRTIPDVLRELPSPLQFAFAVSLLRETARALVHFGTAITRGGKEVRSEVVEPVGRGEFTVSDVVIVRYDPLSVRVKGLTDDCGTLCWEVGVTPQGEEQEQEKEGKEGEGGRCCTLCQRDNTLVVQSFGKFILVVVEELLNRAGGSDRGKKRKHWAESQLSGSAASGWPYVLYWLHFMCTSETQSKRTSMVDVFFILCHYGDLLARQLKEHVQEAEELERCGRKHKPQVERHHQETKGKEPETQKKGKKRRLSYPEKSEETADTTKALNIVDVVPPEIFSLVVLPMMGEYAFVAQFVCKAWRHMYFTMRSSVKANEARLAAHISWKQKVSPQFIEWAHGIKGISQHTFDRAAYNNDIELLCWALRVAPIAPKAGASDKLPNVGIPLGDKKHTGDHHQQQQQEQQEQKEQKERDPCAVQSGDGGNGSTLGEEKHHQGPHSQECLWPATSEQQRTQGQEFFSPDAVQSCRAAARAGCLLFLVYLRHCWLEVTPPAKHSCPKDKREGENATAEENPTQEGTKCKTTLLWDESVCSAAAAGGCINVLQWLRASKCPWDEETPRECLALDRDDMLDWVTANECPVDDLVRHAAQGNHDALYNLGGMYFSGKKVEKDYAKVVSLWQRSAQLGNATAIAGLAFMFENGRGVEPNRAKAVSLYKKAVKKGSAYATHNLGVLYECGRGVEQDFAKAAKLYERAFDMGHTAAIHNLGYMYEKGRGVQQNYGRAAYLYQQAVELGHLYAINNLGYLYENGKGVEKDEAKAAELYGQAAEKGHVDAIHNLGVMFLTGRGIEQDYNKAVELFNRAIEKGHKDAITSLGIMYENGYGVEKDVDRAIQLYKQAAEENRPYAINNLGVMYMHGKGVPQNDIKAARLFQQAVDKHNHVDAMFNLGFMYESGRGVLQDTKRALELYKQSARRGLPRAIYNLGCIYYNGAITKEDKAKAIKYFKRAAQKGHAKASKVIHRLENESKPEATTQDAHEHSKRKKRKRTDNPAAENNDQNDDDNDDEEDQSTPDTGTEEVPQKYKTARKNK